MRRWYGNLTPFNQRLVRLMVLALVAAVPAYTVGLLALLTPGPRPPTATSTARPPTQPPLASPEVRRRLDELPELQNLVHLVQNVGDGDRTAKGLQEVQRRLRELEKKLTEAQDTRGAATGTGARQKTEEARRKVEEVSARLQELTREGASDAALASRLLEHWETLTAFPEVVWHERGPVGTRPE